jgi:hypothetical protein
MDNILAPILMLCLSGSYICERQERVPQIKYYETGKACYIEGVFYESCPKMEWMK